MCSEIDVLKPCCLFHPNSCHGLIHQPVATVTARMTHAVLPVCIARHRTQSGNCMWSHSLGSVAAEGPSANSIPIATGHGSYRHRWLCCRWWYCLGAAGAKLGTPNLQQLPGLECCRVTSYGTLSYVIYVLDHSFGGRGDAKNHDILSVHG